MTYKEALKSMANASNPSAIKNTADQSVDFLKKVIPGDSNITNTPNVAENNIGITECNRSSVKKASPQLSGTVFRISVPQGTAINLLNLIEVASPSGISFIIRLPFIGSLATGGFKNSALLAAIDAVRAAGGTIEVL